MGLAQVSVLAWRHRELSEDDDAKIWMFLFQAPKRHQPILVPSLFFAVKTQKFLERY